MCVVCVSVSLSVLCVCVSGEVSVWFGGGVCLCVWCVPACGNEMKEVSLRNEK